MNPTKPTSKPKRHRSQLLDEVTTKQKNVERGSGNTTKRANQPGLKIDPSTLKRTVEEQHSKDRKVTREQRRLDSLARLIEGNSACSAVFSNGSKLFAASNALNENSQDKKNRMIKFIGDVLAYYSKLAQMTTIPSDLESMTQKMELFKEICVLNMHSQMAKVDNKRYAPYIRKFAEYVLNICENDPLSLNDPLLCRNTNLENFETITGLPSVRDAKVGMLFGVAVIVIPRLARDFKKLEYYFIGSGKDLFQEEPEIVKNGEAPKQNSEEDPENLHAEMQIIQDIIEKTKNLDGYIGISKLSCLDCISVILAINIKNASEMGKEIDQDHEYKIMARGQHNICFKDKWEMPKFLSNNPLLQDLYLKVKKYIQENYPNEGHTSMAHENSDTPPMRRVGIQHQGSNEEF